MQYYNSKGEIVELSGIRSGKFGHNSEIIHMNNGGFYKKYFSQTEKENRIPLEVFEFIKQVTNKHLIKLIERFYEVRRDLMADDVINHPECYLISAYTYKWIKQDNIDIFLMPVDYLTDNLKELLDLADYFSEYGLYLVDTKEENAVLNNSGIVLIDPDIYTFSYKASYKEFPKLPYTDEVKRWNRRMIIDLFKDICRKALQIRDDAPEVTVHSLFEDTEWDGSYDVDIVAKKLKGFKTPLEYVKSTCK